MDYAFPDPQYDTLQLPVSGGAIDYPRIGARPRLAFAQSKVLHFPRQNQLLAALPDADYERGPPYLEYPQSLLTQMAQTAVCNRYHSIEQQLCRWLLLSLDRMPANELRLTHELLSNILGGRREGAT